MTQGLKGFLSYYKKFGESKGVLLFCIQIALAHLFELSFAGWRAEKPARTERYVRAGSEFSAENYATVQKMWAKEIYMISFYLTPTLSRRTAISTD